MTPVETWIYQLRGLTLAERVLLPYYCARANGDGTCFPSYGRTADDCELSRRSVITVPEGCAARARCRSSPTPYSARRSSPRRTASTTVA